jgi:hypothetical protein
LSQPSPKNCDKAFKVPAAGEYVIFTSRSLPITVFSWDGMTVNPKSIEASIPECTEVKGRESFMLAVDTKAQVIRLGGDSAQGVDLVLIPATP